MSESEAWNVYPGRDVPATSLLRPVSPDAVVTELFLVVDSSADLRPAGLGYSCLSWTVPFHAYMQHRGGSSWQQVIPSAQARKAVEGIGKTPTDHSAP